MEEFKQTRVTKPKFRFHKHLNSSRYNEFLAESDDEEFFNSKPVTKDGREFDFDFKIDTYRDQIRFNKNKGDQVSKKKLLVIKNSRDNASNIKGVNMQESKAESYFQNSKVPQNTGNIDGISVT